MGCQAGLGSIGWSVIVGRVGHLLTLVLDKLSHQPANCTCGTWHASLICFVVNFSCSRYCVCNNKLGVIGRIRQFMGRISPVRVSATVSFCCRFQLQQILCATINSVHLACLLTSCSITLHWRFRNRGTFYKYLALSWDSDTKMSFISFFINSILKAKHQVSVDIAGNRKRRKQNCGFFVKLEFYGSCRLKIKCKRRESPQSVLKLWILGMGWGGGNKGATICANRKKSWCHPAHLTSSPHVWECVCACFVCLFVPWVLWVALSCIVVVVIWSEFCDKSCCLTGYIVPYHHYESSWRSQKGRCCESKDSCCSFLSGKNALRKVGRLEKSLKGNTRHHNPPCFPF